VTDRLMEVGRRDPMALSLYAADSLDRGVLGRQRAPSGATSNRSVVDQGRDTSLLRRNLEAALAHVSTVTKSNDEPNYADQVMKQRLTNDKRVIELELPDVICAAVLYETSKCRQAIEQLTRVHVDIRTRDCADPNTHLVRLTGPSADTTASAHYMLRSAGADEIRSRVHAVGGSSM